MLRRFAATPAFRAPARAFWSTPRLSNAATLNEDARLDAEMAEHLADHEAQFASQPQHGTVLYAYGGYSFYGLLATVLVSKEIYVIDDMTPSLAFLACTIVGGIWLMGPSTYKTTKAIMLREEQDRHDTFELINGLVDNQINAIQSFSNQPAALREFSAQYKETVTELAHAQVRQAKYEAYQATVAQLQTIVNQKAAARVLEAKISHTVLNNYLNNAFRDPELVDRTIEESIEHLDNYGVPLEDSIVMGVYDEYVDSGKYDFERYEALENPKQYFDNLAKS